MMLSTNSFKAVLSVLLFLLFLFSLAFSQSDSLNMRLLGTWTSPDSFDFSHRLLQMPNLVGALTVLDDHAYLAAATKIYSIDISNLNSPTQDTVFGGSTSICTDGTYLLVSGGNCIRRYTPNTNPPTFLDSIYWPGYHMVGFACDAMLNEAGDSGVVTTWDWTGVIAFRYLPTWRHYSHVHIGEQYFSSCISNTRPPGLFQPIIFYTSAWSFPDTSEYPYTDINGWKIRNPNHGYGSWDTSAWACDRYPFEGGRPFDIVAGDSLIFVSRGNSWTSATKKLIGVFYYSDTSGGPWPWKIYHIDEWEMNKDYISLYLNKTQRILYAGSFDGVLVLDVCDPCNPETLGYYYGSGGDDVIALNDSIVLSTNGYTLFIHQVVGMDIQCSNEKCTDFDYAIFPNPINRSAKCKLPDVVKRAQVFDLTGRLVSNTENTSEITVPQTCGLYLLRIKTTNGQRILKKILVIE